MSDRAAIQVRSAVHDDLAGLTALAVSVQQLHPEARPDIFPDADASALRAFLDRQVRGGAPLFVAECDGRAGGYLLAELQVKEETAFKRACTLLYVHQLAVHPSMQAKGIGTALMQAALDLARMSGASAIRLDSWSFNTRAREFFGHRQFQPINTVFERARL